MIGKLDGDGDALGRHDLAALLAHAFEKFRGALVGQRHRPAPVCVARMERPARQK